MEGWIKLYRAVLGHRLFEEREPFDKRSAWVYMLLTANHKDGVASIEGTDVEVKRGSFLSSVKRLSNEWMWSRTKVNRFLKECVSNGEIVFQTNKRYTIISIKNYEKYQGNTVEITIKKEPTLEHTKKADFSLDITGDSSISETYLKSRLANTNNNKDKELLNTLSEFKVIIDYLNMRAGTKYRHQSAVTQRYIRARMNDGYTVEDFKAVIEIKCDEWLNTDMRKFIRPETLFGTKFEGYLNQVPKKKETNALPTVTMTAEEVQKYERLFDRQKPT